MRDKLDTGFYFEYRPGIGQFPGWQGMQLDSDPGSIPGNALALGLNVRFVPGGVRPRYGIRKVADLPPYSPADVWSAGTGAPQEQINWLGMHHMQFHPPRLWVGSQTCYNMGVAATGAFLRWYNPDKSPMMQSAGSFVAEVDRLPTIGAYGGEMYFGDWAVLQRPNVVEATRGETDTLGARQSFTEQVVGYPGFDCTALQEFDGKLFMALNNPSGGTSQIAYWDGVSLTLGDHDTGANPVTNFCVWRNDKLAMFQPGTGKVLFRDTAGTWSEVTAGGGGANANKYKNSMVEFRDSIFLANGQVVYEISNFNTPASAAGITLPSGSYEARAVTVLGDNLYYLYNYWTGSAYQVWIGHYEPDRAGGTWSQEYVRIDEGVQEVPGYFSSFPSGATTLTTYRNRLYAGGGSGIVITHALPVDPLSDWYEVLPYAGTMPATVLRVN